MAENDTSRKDVMGEKPAASGGGGGGAAAMPLVEVLSALMRVAASVIGLVVMVFGLTFGIRLFEAVIEGIRKPETIEAIFRKWVAVVGGETLDLHFESVKISLAPVMAGAAIGGAALLLCLLVIVFLSTGAKIVAWNSGEREAIKRILEHALGRRSGEHPSETPL